MDGAATCGPEPNIRLTLRSRLTALAPPHLINCTVRLQARGTSYDPPRPLRGRPGTRHIPMHAFLVSHGTSTPFTPSQFARRSEQAAPLPPTPAPSSPQNTALRPCISFPIALLASRLRSPLAPIVSSASTLRFPKTIHRSIPPAFSSPARDSPKAGPPALRAVLAFCARRCCPRRPACPSTPGLAAWPVCAGPG